LNFAAGRYRAKNSCLSDEDRRSYESRRFLKKTVELREGDEALGEVTGNKPRSHEYELGHTEQELNRLNTQARLVDPFTRWYFREAGIGEGMRVLDVGSGAGDVAFLAAELVGKTGEVVGTDRSHTAVAAATARADSRGLRNVSFQLGNPAELSFDHPFDAAVGRYVLMFNSDPAALLGGITRQVRPGGIVVFHEAEWTTAKSSPPVPLYDQCCQWIIETFEKVGTDPYMGKAMYHAFQKAGLPPPTMSLSALFGGGDNERNGAGLIADLAVTMAPVMEQHGVVTQAALDPATLKKRMISEIVDRGSVVTGRSEVGAWSRVAETL
jgi:ubiquinone/menaquinone biosynthesis C-methylase UbiE